MKKSLILVMLAALVLAAAAFSPLGQEQSGDGPTAIYVRQTEYTGAARTASGAEHGHRKLAQLLRDPAGMPKIKPFL